MSASPYRYLSRHPKISIVNAGFGGAQRKLGVETAPSIIIKAGLEKAITSSGRLVAPSRPAADYTSLRPSDDAKHRGMTNPRWVSAATESISEQVCQEAKLGNQVLTLGGDHSVAIGTLTGAVKAVRERFGPEQKIGVIYVDAHADLNVPEDSESGNVHGMAVAFASRLACSREPSIFNWITEQHSIDLDKFVYIGLRDVDDSEKRTIENCKMLAFWMDDVRRLGIEEVTRQCLEYLGNVPIHVSFDIDGLDPIYAPSTGLPVPSGLTLAEGIHIMHQVRDSGRLIAMDVVEINPGLGSADDVRRTVSSAFEVIEAGIGNLPLP